MVSPPPPHMMNYCPTFGKHMYIKMCDAVSPRMNQKVHQKEIAPQPVFPYISTCMQDVHAEKLQRDYATRLVFFFVCPFGVITFFNESMNAHAQRILSYIIKIIVHRMWNKYAKYVWNNYGKEIVCIQRIIYSFFIYVERRRTNKFYQF